MARLLALAGIVLGVAAAAGGCRSGASQPPVVLTTSVPSATTLPPISVTIQFSQDISDPVQFISPPAGWTIEGDRPGRKFGLRPPTVERDSSPTVSIRAGAPGYEAGLKLHLTDLPNGGAGVIASGTALPGEAISDRKALQASVDEGHTPWRVVPEEVALEYLNDEGLHPGPLLPQVVQLAPDQLRLLLSEPGMGRHFEVIMQRADPGVENPAWIAVAGTAGS